MSFYERFENSPKTFRDRIGSPSEFDAALGLVIVGFQDLEAVIGIAIASLLKTDSQTATIVTTELSFKKLVNVLGALAHHQLAATASKQTDERVSRLDELLKLCFFLGEKRNQLIHSFWPMSRQTGVEALRLKRTATKRGLREQRESMDAGRILDIADYAAYVAEMLEEFFDLDYGAADRRG